MSTSENTSMSDSTSHSMNTTDQNGSHDQGSQDQSGSTSGNHNTDGNTALPDTGQSSNHTGLFGAVLAMLAGLGLIKRSKKDKKGNKDEA